MNLTIAVPGLTWLDGLDGAEAARDLAVPALSRLLGRARLTRRSVPLSQLLCEPFGLTAPAIAGAAARLDGLATDGRAWLLADPVNLRIDRDRALLADVGVMHLAQDEADALVAALNRHFADDDLRFFAPHPGRWYLSLPTPPDATFTSLPDAIGENVDPLLPQGADGLALGRLINEMQMLLFSHPVNEARESRGEPAVNSVWLWGAGSAEPRAPQQRLFAAHPLTGRLAGIAGVDAGFTPYAFAALQEAPGGDADCRVELDRLLGPAQYRDVWGWRDAIAGLERDWFAPLLAALADGRLQTLTLLSHGECGLQARLCRRDLWKFWRRDLALATLYR